MIAGKQFISETWLFSFKTVTFTEALSYVHMPATKRNQAAISNEKSKKTTVWTKLLRSTI